MKGSCLCGAIEYEIDSIDMPVAHCHCRTCQKAHATAFASTAGIMREHFRWLRGEELHMNNKRLDRFVEQSRFAAHLIPLC